MTLTILILLPLVGALVTAFAPHAVARLVGLGFAGATLVAGIVAAVQYQADAGMQLTELMKSTPGGKLPLPIRMMTAVTHHFGQFWYVYVILLVAAGLFF